MPRLVGEHLHLDVAGALHQLLQVDLVAAEGGLGLAPRRDEVAAKIGFAGEHAHAASAAAPRRLQHQRIADIGSHARRRIGIVGQRLARRHHRHAHRLRQLARGDLVAELAHGLRRRPDEDDAGLGAGGGEVRVLRQQAIARVDGVDVRLARDADHLTDVEIGGDGSQTLADLVGLVRLEPVQGELVLLGEHRHGGDAELVGRAEDANGDLRPVGDKDLADGQNAHSGGNSGQALYLAGLCGCEKALCECEENEMRAADADTPAKGRSRPCRKSSSTAPRGARPSKRRP